MRNPRPSGEKPFLKAFSVIFFLEARPAALPLCELRIEPVRLTFCSFLEPPFALDVLEAPAPDGPAAPRLPVPPGPRPEAAYVLASCCFFFCFW
jgi:hypothetical protein